MRRIFLVFSVMSLFALPAHAIPSSGCSPDTAFENDQLKIWFQGFKGHIQVENKSDGATYELMTHTLDEVDGSGTILASMNLGRAYPQTTDACTVEQNGNQVTVTYGVTDDVRAGHTDGGNSSAGAGNVVGQASVKFVFHFNTSDNGSKFDLLVDNWPWQSTASTLAFDLDITAENATIQPADNGVGFSDANGNPRGYVDWGSSFAATYADGTTQNGTPSATTTVNGQAASAHIVFPGVDAGYVNLTYDPWASVGLYVVVGPKLIGDQTINGVLGHLP